MLIAEGLDVYFGDRLTGVAARVDLEIDLTGGSLGEVRARIDAPDVPHPTGTCATGTCATGEWMTLSGDRLLRAAVDFASAPETGPDAATGLNTSELVDAALECLPSPARPTSRASRWRVGCLFTPDPERAYFPCLRDEQMPRGIPKKCLPADGKVLVRLHREVPDKLVFDELTATEVVRNDGVTVTLLV